MNVDYLRFDCDRKFGVELEVNRNVTQEKLVEIVNKSLGNKRVHCVSQGWGYSCNNKQWIVKTDSSCGDLGDKDKDGGGFEVVSPADRGTKHLLKIEKVTAALREGAAVVNDYCGFHCQVDIGDFTTSQAATLLAYWCKIEPIISHMVPDRRNNNSHCRLFTTNTKKWPEVSNITTASAFWKSMKLPRLDAPAKRTTLTLVNFQRSISKSGEWSYFDRPTVELRYPEGTLLSYNVKNWTRLFIHFVESCKNRPFPDNLKPASLDETFEILGLKKRGTFLVLSPGLWETKLWILHRLSCYARSSGLKDEVLRQWQLMTSPGMKWRLEFPQVKSLDLPMNEKIGYEGEDVGPLTSEKRGLMSKQQKAWGNYYVRPIEFAYSYACNTYDNSGL